MARIELDFAATATKGEGVLPAPPELRNRMARLDIEAQGGAGSTVLLDERKRRRPVVDPGRAGRPPTASRCCRRSTSSRSALDPYVSLTIGDRETVLTRNTAVLLIPDGAAPSATDRDEIAKWIERGGVAVRFAGPNLAAGGDTLVPTPLRLGDRALGGVMSWGQPTALAEFPANSPFLGIPIPKDVRISQQVLAEPTPDLADKTWARLTDGTPLVTGEKRGQGYLVLIHTTANTSWSNLALSGLFVNMLQRLVTLSRGVAGDGVNKALKPWRTLDGFGRLGAPPAGAQMLPPDADRDLQAQADHAARPLRRRERPGRLQHRRPRRAEPKPLVLPVGVATDQLSEGGETDLSRWFLLAAAAAAAGRPAALAVAARPAAARGALRPRRAGGAAAARPRRHRRAARRAGADARRSTRRRPSRSTVAAPAPDKPGPPPLSEEQALKGSLDIRLAYIVTGDKEVDDISKAGLEGLSEILRNRTSVEPADPVGLDLEKDEPRLYPLIYWPITSTQPALSPKRLGRARPLPAHRRHPVHRHARPAAVASTGRPAAIPTSSACWRGIETPPLIAMPPDHVLTKSFYLLSDMPGRWQGGKLWIEVGQRPGQ